MKFNFNKTKVATALAVAALIGTSAVAADAASFVRVPTVAGAQVSNGGLSPAADSSDGSTAGTSGGGSPAPRTNVELAFTRTSQRTQAPAGVSCQVGDPQNPVGGVRKRYTAHTAVTLNRALQVYCANAGGSDVKINYAIGASATQAMVHGPTGDAISYTFALTGATDGSVTVPAGSSTLISTATATATVPAGQAVHGGIYEGVVTLKLNY